MANCMICGSVTSDNIIQSVVTPKIKTETKANTITISKRKIDRKKQIGRKCLNKQKPQQKTNANSLSAFLSKF